MMIKPRRLWRLSGALSVVMTSSFAGAADAPDPNPYALEQARAVAKAKVAEAVADKHYKVPRTGYGQPDLEGVWTNVSITPLERARQFGSSVNLTAEQAATLEASAIDHYIEGNAPTDPSAPATDTTRKHC